MKSVPVNPLRRLVAYMLDWYLATMLAGAPLVLVNSMRSGVASANSSIPPGTQGWVWGIIAILLGAAYYMLPLVWHGQTVGKRLLHLRICTLEGKSPSAGALLLRQIVGVLLIEGGLAFPSQLLRELIARAFGAEVANIVRIAMVAATLVSIMLGLYTPSRRMLHDRISGTHEIYEKPEK